MILFLTLFQLLLFGKLFFFYDFNCHLCSEDSENFMFHFLESFLQRAILHVQLGARQRLSSIYQLPQPKHWNLPSRITAITF